MPNIQQFKDKKYLNLETYRKNGVAVLTPVWFAEQNGVFYVYSVANAGKVKRIRNNPRVRLVPCDIRGGIDGEWIAGQAHIDQGEAAKLGDQLLTRKYGLLKRIGNLYSKLIGRERAFISIMVE